MKRNLILQTAVAAMFGIVGVSAHAGTGAGVPVAMAAQAVVSAATGLVGGNVAYSTQVPIAVGPPVYVYVKLSGGAKFLQAAGGAIAAGALVVTSPGGATATVGAGVVSTDQTYAYFPVTITIAPMPVNAVFTFKPTSVAAANGGISAAFLSAPLSSLTITMSFGSAANLAATLADVDTAATGTTINSVNGVAFAALSSGAPNFAAGPGNMAGVAVENKRVDVITVPGTAMTTAGGNTTGSSVLINFGGYSFTNIPGVVAADGATVFNIATNYTVVYSAVLTGNYGAALAAGGNVFLSTSNACAAVTTAATAGTAATGAAAFAGITAPTSGTPLYACMQLSTANAIGIPSTTPSLVVTLPGTGIATTSTTAASLYTLSPNGGTVDVRSYVPAGTIGYTGFVRVINTGGVAAPISAAVINAATGAVGASAVVIPSLPAGGAVTLTSAQIEAAVGVVDPATRPRLRVSGATTLQAQSFILTNANGNFGDVTGAQ